MESGRCTGSQSCVRENYGISFRSVIITVMFAMIIALLVVALNNSVSNEVGGAEPDQVLHHEVTIENLTYFIVNSTIEIHAYDGANASEFRLAFDAASPANKSDMVNAMELVVLDEAMDVLRNIFNGTYHFKTNVTTNLTTLDIDQGPEVPIFMWANSSSELQAVSYDLPPEAFLEDVIYGTLNMGAVVKLDVELIAPDNATATYVFTPPAGTVIEEHTTGTHGVNNVTWFLDNSGGFAPERHEDLRLRAEFPNPVTEEDIRVTFVIDRKLFELTTVNVDIEVHSVEVARYGNLSTSIVSLDYITADGIRMVVNNGLLNWTWQRIYEETIRSNEEEIERAMSEALNVTVEMDFSWDNDTLEGYDVNTMSSEPPIRSALRSDDVTPQLYAIGNESFGVDDIKLAKGFLNAGGKAEFDIPEIDLKLWVAPDAKLILSPNMRLENYTGVEALETDNRYSYTWDPSGTFHGRIKSTLAKTYNSSRVEIDVTVDLNDLDVNWLNIKETSVDIDVFGDLDFYRIEVPEELLEDLPHGITIDYIISDVLRLAYDTGLIDLEEITDIIDNETEEIEEELKESIGENVFLDITIRENTLVGYDINNMSEKDPVSIRGVAHISIVVADQLEEDGEGEGEEDDSGQGDGGGSGTRGFAFQQTVLYYILRDFSFDFTIAPVEDWTITFTLIIPTGIVITDVEDELGLVEKGTTGGRHYVKLTIGEVENNLTVTVGLTPMFFINICMLPIIIIITIIVLLVHRRRTKKKRKKEKKKREEEEMKRTPGSFYQVQQMKGKLKELEKEKEKLDKKEKKEEKKRLKQEEKTQKKQEKTDGKKQENGNDTAEGKKQDESGRNDMSFMPKPLTESASSFAPPPSPEQRTQNSRPEPLTPPPAATPPPPPELPDPPVLPDPPALPDPETPPAPLSKGEDEDK